MAIGILLVVLCQTANEVLRLERALARDAWTSVLEEILKVRSSDINTNGMKRLIRFDRETGLPIVYD